jgi:hypothetical protein
MPDRHLMMEDGGNTNGRLEHGSTGDGDDDVNT